MLPNKNRLYVAVYPSEEAPNDEESFNWSFLIGPKVEDKVINPGKRYHVERVRPGTPAHAAGMLWRYAETSLPSVSAPRAMYARILVAKIVDEDRLVRLLRETYAPPALADGESDAVAMARRAGWDSQLWIATVFDLLRGMRRAERMVGTAVLDWPLVERTARLYVAAKMASERYKDDVMRLPKPTWDMLLGKETTP